MIDRMNAQSVDYNDLTNKPTINGVTVTGALTSADLHIAPQPEFVIAGDQTWLSGELIEITDEDNIAKLDGFFQAYANNERPVLKLGTSGYTFDLTQSQIQYEDQEGAILKRYTGFGYIGSVGFVLAMFDNATGFPDTPVWSVQLTPISQ